MPRRSEANVTVGEFESLEDASGWAGLPVGLPGVPGSTGFSPILCNQACKLDRYPIPRIEDLFATLAGGESFTKLDMSQAFQQILLDEESKSNVAELRSVLQAGHEEVHPKNPNRQNFLVPIPLSQHTAYHNWCDTIRTSPWQMTSL